MGHHSFLWIGRRRYEHVRNGSDRRSDKSFTRWRSLEWPSAFELLEGVTAQQAAARPLKNTHTIWELVGHLAVWAEETRARYHGNGRERLSPEENFPPAPELVDESTWNTAKKRLLTAHESWCAELERIDPEQLYPPQQGKFPSLYVILHGLVQHNLYHAGQIAVIKKAF